MSRLARPTTSARCARPTRSPSTRTNGSTRRSRPGARWSAILRNCAGPSRTRPAYYHFDSGDAAPPPNYYEFGPQNSRGFRALKVWLALQQVGRRGYETMIGEDIRLSRVLFDLAAAHPELEAATQGLSITTFRYVPAGVSRDDPAPTTLLNALNSRILDRLLQSGRAYVSNAMVDGRFLLRSCIVNFRTSEPDLRELVDAVVEIGRAVHNHEGTMARRHEGTAST